MRKLLKNGNAHNMILAKVLLLIICVFVAYFFWSWAELKDNSADLISIAMHTLV